MERRHPSGERDALLRWYDANARCLPWRQTRDPYAIWVSEIMLQQTRVETVIPYYARFLARFPDTRALAHAEEDDVLSAWSGLGYYRRARLLHAGVREVVARYGGAIPEAADARRALPGVGRYTAGAIGSIAFGLEEPVVDGNVARVLARLRGVETPLGSSETSGRLWAEAEALVRGPRPGDLNQALMELGALVCVPRAPRCTACPVRGGCVARREGRQAELPVAAARRRPIEVRQVAVVATAGDAVVLARGERGLFGGLWSIPSGEGSGARAARSAIAAVGVRGGRLREAGLVSHVLTHRRLLVEVYVLRAFRLAPRSRGQLVGPDRAARLGLSRLTHKLIARARTTPHPG